MLSIGRSFHKLQNVASGLIVCLAGVHASTAFSVERQQYLPGDLSELVCRENGSDELRCLLIEPMKQRDAKRIEAIVTAELGADSADMVSAAVSDSESKHTETSEPPVSQRALSAFAARYAGAVANRSWWKTPPAEVSEYAEPLRIPASVVQGMLDFSVVFEANGSDYRQQAIVAGDFLIDAWQAAGGVFAFPDWRAKDSHLGRIASNVLAAAAKHGLEDAMLVNGWIAEDPGDGSLYFDNSLAGEAMLDLYKVTGDKKYLDVAVAAARWAQNKPLVPNFNYNAFSALLEARVARELGDRTLLSDALDRLDVGVLSGMIRKGARSGHWVDEHNNKIVYRMIMARALLISIDASDDMGVDTSQLISDTKIVLAAIDEQILASSEVPNPESALRLYCALENYGASLGGASLMRSSRQLREIGFYQLSANKLVVAPSSIGCFLRILAQNNGSK